MASVDHIAGRRMLTECHRYMVIVVLYECIIRRREVDNGTGEW